MLKQQIMAAVSKHVRLPLGKRLMLITALLLPGESLVAVVFSQDAYASVAVGPGQVAASIAGVPGQAVHVNNVTFIACHAGDGGPGGISSHSTDGGRGGNGGDCLIH